MEPQHMSGPKGAYGGTAHPTDVAHKVQSLFPGEPAEAVSRLADVEQAAYLRALAAVVAAISEENDQNLRWRQAFHLYRSLTHSLFTLVAAMTKRS